MQIILIVTQVLHVLSGVFWAGTTFALARMSSDQTTQMFRPQMGAAVVAVATGGLLWFLLHRGPPGPQEHVLALGAIFALVAASIQGITAGARWNRPGLPEVQVTRLRRRVVTGQRIAPACWGSRSPAWRLHDTSDGPPIAAGLARRRGVDRLKNRIALVTGSSRGIGAAIARLFAREGAKVALHGRDVAALSDVLAEIEWTGGRARLVTGDTTSFGDIEDMRRHVERELGPIDILIANAGGNVGMPGPVEHISEEEWRAAVDVNLTATFLSVKSILPGMKERRSGNIITISSAAARRPNPHSPIPYAAAKAGTEIFTQDLAAQAGPFGIRVNCIAPEIILTERNKERIPAAQQEALRDLHPIRRLGRPEDVAHAALFLVSEHAAWIAGVILDVAGGAVMV